jgi:rod shape-determining protein MreD
VILSGGALLRVGLLLLAAVVLQVSSIGPIRVLGGNADLVPLMVAAVALYAGSVPGAATGFAAGLLLDLTLGQSVGASSLVLTAVGYWVGRYREVRDPAHGLLPIPVAAAATACWGAAFAAVSFMLEIEASVSPLVFREMLMTAVLNALIALPVFAITRRVVRPVLTVDPFEVRRRRQPPRESGPLGLRGLQVR